MLRVVIMRMIHYEGVHYFILLVKGGGGHFLKSNPL
jgi:hypothetical protein